MPLASGFAPLASREPSVDELVAAILEAYRIDARKKAVGVDVGRTRRADGGETDPGVCFAGLGDPLLRWRDVVQVAELSRLALDRPDAGQTKPESFVFVRSLGKV